MSARFPDREASVLGPPNLETRLDKYPGLRAKVEGMLAIVEHAGGDVAKAAVAEQRVIDAMRELGQDVLQEWAHRQQDTQAAACQATPGVKRKEKKRSTAGALAAERPMGSGEIESAHRYIRQSRLKRAGAWWTADNLAHMLALRVLRANGEWDAYWTRVNQRAA